MNRRIALLTGGGDKPYALGMAAALTQSGVELDLIGSDELATPDLLRNPRVRFLNLRGAQGAEASIGNKIRRVIFYYIRLLNYALGAKPKIFHLLWNNKFELFDRTVLMLLYKVTGRKVLLTVHNVNAAERDGNDSWLNRLSLRIQYGLTDHLFVHTERMKSELQTNFSVKEEKISVVPFGINNTVANTDLSPAEARSLLTLKKSDKALLFFGNIAPYKGLEHLVAAFSQLAKEDKDYRLIIAGRPKLGEHYWDEVRELIGKSSLESRITARIEYIPDEETEIFFKAADLLVLPYTLVFQSGVLFLGYSFGLPAVATDVGSLKEEVIESKTGFMAARADAESLAAAIRRYFSSDLWLNLEERREAIKSYANERYSWDKVATIITGIYQELLEPCDRWKGCKQNEEELQSRI